MSLIFTITFPGAHPDAVRQTAEAAQDVSGLKVSGPKVKWFSLKDPPVVALPEAHDFLSENADRNSEMWDLVADGRARIAQALEVLHEGAHDIMIVRASWANEDALNAERVTIEDLCRIVRDNQIGTRTSYRVPRH